jgi:GNAT superfamily N-acetyltransferase
VTSLETLMPDPAIRPCGPDDRAAILDIVNAAAEAYRGVIPEDCFNDPYMSSGELDREIAAGVRFFGLEEDGSLVGVMGIQDVDDVTLIRHAYVLPAAQRRGIGGRLLAHLLSLTERPVLIGTWAAAGWAVRFYQRNGFVQVTPRAKDLGLRRYWNIPERQVETSVVLADERARRTILAE